MPAFFTSLRCCLLLLIPGFVAIGCASASDLILHPDDQTAWMQSNDEFAVGDRVSQNHWTVTPTIKVTSENGGVKIVSSHQPGEGTPSIVRYMPFSEDYPWLQFDISDVAKLDGYRGLTIILGNLDTNTRSVVGNLPEGRYVTRVTPGPEKKADASRFVLRMDVFGLQFILKDLGMKSDPLPRLEAHPMDGSREMLEIGDKMKVTVYLANPAEDVSVELLNRRMGSNLSIDGTGFLQLKPENAEGKIWSGVFSLERLNVHPISKGKPVPRGALLFKATILGGNFSQPLLNWNEQSWNVNP